MLDPSIPPTFKDFAVTFFARKFGGIELECFISLQEIIYCLGFFHSGPFVSELIPNPISRLLLGIVLFLSFSSTFLGVYLFFKSNRLCEPLRWFGAVVSIMIWAVLSVRAPNILFGLLWITYAFAQTRIGISAWRRPWPIYVD